MVKANKRILIIDNNFIFSESVKAFLEERDYVVRTCDETKEVPALLEKFSPDVIILDLKISGTNGFDILKRVRSQNKDIKIIIVSGSADPEKITRAQELGANEYMIKPVSMSDLRGVIDKL